MSWSSKDPSWGPGPALAGSNGTHISFRIQHRRDGACLATPPWEGPREDLGSSKSPMATSVKLCQQAGATSVSNQFCWCSETSKKKVENGSAGPRLDLHPEHFVSTEMPAGTPKTGKQGTAATLHCCGQYALWASPVRCVILVKVQPVTNGYFCSVSLLSPPFLCSNRKTEVGSNSWKSYPDGGDRKSSGMAGKGV